jgi:D-tyrosyl-tRNA(Tyr) deacylase
MKILIQRSKQSSVKVEGEIVGKIEHGMVLFVCFEQDDNEEKIDLAIHKLINLRIFEDENNKMTFNILQTKGSFLSISQFTLSWDGSGGHRPSFDRSMPPKQAKLMYAIFNKKLKEHCMVESGVFGAMMEVAITNDGPVTFQLSF